MCLLQRHYISAAECDTLMSHVWQPFSGQQCRHWTDTSLAFISCGFLISQRYMKGSQIWDTDKPRQSTSVQFLKCSTKTILMLQGNGVLISKQRCCNSAVNVTKVQSHSFEVSIFLWEQSFLRRMASVFRWCCSCMWAIILVCTDHQCNTNIQILSGNSCYWHSALLLIYSLE